MKTKLYLSLLLILILLLPFSLSDKQDNINPEVLSDSSIGYYQSTTCKISLFEFYTKNLNNSINVYFNNNNYADVRCFGKITGVDKLDDSYMVSIGTNTSINFIIQTSIWLLLFMFIPKNNMETKYLSKLTLIIPFVFIVQYLGEGKFYSKQNIIHNSEIKLDNFYLLSIFLFLVLISFVCQDIFKNRESNLINFFPFIFLIVGTYAGMNLNIYLIVISFFGVQSLQYKEEYSKIDLAYFLFSMIWILNTKNNEYFFDGDKLRGFTNSTFNETSQIFWIVVFYLICKGTVSIVKKSLNYFNLNKLIKNFLISGSLIVLLGIAGSHLPIVNFFNFYLFGQNKRGMKEFSSVAGNTWRGFSASAESIGEYFALIILLVAYLVIYRKTKLNYLYLTLVIPIIYGLYRSNNFAAILSLILTITILLVIKTRIFKGNRRFFTIGALLIILAGLLTYVLNNDYDYLSTELVYEATLHQDFYSDPNSYKSFLQVEQKMIERDLNSILNNEENLKNASSSYIFVVDRFTQGINIPLVPNLIALISTVSLVINRTEMWGIFIAKYNPTLLESLFGTGPLQLNKYLSEHQVKLDLPNNRLQELFLPHSSILDVLIFFGFFGLFFALGLFIYLLGRRDNSQLFKFVCFYLFLNLIKSDSILYLNSFILILICFLHLMYSKDSITNEK
tara:strand:- start:1968 stop:3995 length:2028 start_codon:yes stop_codon:yes gene_type:complete